MSEKAGADDRILPQADFPIEELSVVLLFEGPARAGMDRDEVQRLADEHLRFTIDLVEAAVWFTPEPSLIQAATNA